ncbi:DUF4932 domain-containing protein [Xanthovirga aplysinae]|uniref:DUF4932 domain-containing protein n=1 Tax=Xanthovirga aplysinae TaxID=2529853 RepID=UPI0012BCADB0|nr:DUF4932 domain-containing protein [Xanthovirga aplysinae]MTI30862.1 DUF4932 domain-containing protein [Xanthovirga aplysinae]
MKKVYMTIVLLLLSFFSCYSSEIEKKEIMVGHNKNLEILFTVYNQTWTPFLDNNASNYMLEHTKLMQKNYHYFKKFKDHKAIQLTNNILGRSGTDFFLLAFYYDTFPNPKRIREIPLKILKDINPDSNLALLEIDNLMNEISDFFQESDFEMYYQENEYIYKKAKEEVYKNLPDENFIPFMERYFGHKKNSYHFIVVPFFKSHFGMAFQIKNKNDFDIYSFISSFKPQIINKNKIVENVGFDSKKDVLNWVIHEYSHSFFTPIVNKPGNLESLNRFEHLFKPINNNPQIGDWYSMFGEHLAVAFEIRAAELMGDKEGSKKLIDSHKDWHYLDHFLEKLKYYELNRDQYENIEKYIPYLISSLKNLK